MISALVLSAVLSAQAVPPVDRDCRDDNGTDRCAAESRAQTLTSLGMASVEDELAAGAEVYRTLQVDGYGRLMAGVAFERRVGSSPQIVVYGPNGARMTAPAPLDDWRKVQQDARLADRELVPRGTIDELGLCLHAWVSTVEIANPANRGAPEATVRRRTQSACGDGLTSRFAFDLVGRAIKAFPDCDALDPDDHRNDAARLTLCVGFKGDRLAAVDLMNQAGWRVVPEQGADTELAWMRALGGNGSIKLEWAGERIDGGGTFRSNPVAVFLVRKTAELDGLRGYVLSHDAVSSTRIETTGRLDFDTAEDVTHSAPFRQVWLWNRNSLAWQLDSWTVEPFVPAR